MSITKSLFNYLESEKIYVDKEEFTFQFNSHPDYPSLLTISDTLHFFNIPNIALKLASTDIDKLPNKFLAKLKTETNEFFSTIEKREDKFIYTTDESKKRAETTLEGLISIWGEIVLLADNEVSIAPSTKKPKRIGNLLLLLTLFLFIGLFYNYFLSYPVALFFVLSGLGLFLSVAALKELFNTKINIVDKLCNIGLNTSCSSVLNSSKWKIFKYISFSDLGVVFFSTQLTTLFIFSLFDLSANYFQIQIFLLVLALPVIVLSIYYQKFIEKKWCPICLSISGLIVLELLTVFGFYTFKGDDLSLFSALLYGFVFSFNALVWYYLKSSLTNIKKLKESEIASNRFKRNYNTFKPLMLSTKQYKLPTTKLVLGNMDAILKISIITSPFCGFCEEPYKMLKSIEKRYGDKLQISVLYNVTSSDDWLRRFVYINTEKYLENQNNFYDVMDYWYDVKDGDTWLKRYQIKDDTGINDFSEELLNQSNFFSKNDLNFTPSLFINGYKYPKGYKIEELPFFIEELIEDFNKKQTL